MTSLTVPEYSAATGRMDFSQALLSLKMGNTLRREGWMSGMWVRFDSETRRDQLVVRFPDMSTRRWLVAQDDVLAGDWVEALVPFGETR